MLMHFIKINVIDHIRALRPAVALLFYKEFFLIVFYIIIINFNFTL